MRVARAPLTPPPPDGVVNTVLKQNSKIQKLQILPFVPQKVAYVSLQKERYMSIIWSDLSACL